MNDFSPRGTSCSQNEKQGHSSNKMVKILGQDYLSNLFIRCRLAISVNHDFMSLSQRDTASGRCERAFVASEESEHKLHEILRRQKPVLSLPKGALAPHAERNKPVIY